MKRLPMLALMPLLLVACENPTGPTKDMGELPVEWLIRVGERALAVTEATSHYEIVSLLQEVWEAQNAPERTEHALALALDMAEYLPEIVTIDTYYIRPGEMSDLPGRANASAAGYMEVLRRSLVDLGVDYSLVSERITDEFMVPSILQDGGGNEVRMFIVGYRYVLFRRGL